MSLGTRGACERCGSGVEADGTAYTCSHERTPCAGCAQEVGEACPSCGGELVRRPRQGTR